MSHSRVALVVLFFAAFLVSHSPAQATYSMICTGTSTCVKAGYPDGGYSAHRSTSYWNMYTGTNCTNYVAYRLITTNGMSTTRPKSGVGNAEDWGRVMSSITDSRPTIGSVAWWGTTGHHVAYVEKVVSSTEIWVSESNWAGAFDWRKIVKSGSGWPDGFIHFADTKIVNVTKPVIFGTVKVGGALSSSGGTWSPTGNTYGFQWLANGQPIVGATTRKFTPTAAQLGKKLSLSVTATRASFPVAKAVSPAIVVAPGKLTATTAPSIIGTARVDSPLTAVPGSWSPAASSFTYQWFVGGVKVPGATGKTFTPGPTSVGQAVTVRVQAARTGYDPVAANSAATASLSPGPLSSVERPSVIGDARVGSPLTATPGTWSKPGLSFTYQWFRAGAKIDGATRSTYRPTAADRDATVTVHVTARRLGYVTTSVSSRPSDTIARGTLTVTARPTLTGTARVGSRLTARPGSWSPIANFSYQWYADGRPIQGATATTYLPTRHDLGARVRVRVTARRDGYTTLSALSPATTPLTIGHISITTKPTITGSPRLGQRLAVTAGTHTPRGATMRYQWLLDGSAIRGVTGSAHRVRASELGHRLSVRVTLGAAGYATRSLTTAAVGPAKATSAVTVGVTKPSAGRVTFTIRVAAPGVAAPNGTVTVRYGSTGEVRAKVTNGRASIPLTAQDPGVRNYRFTYGGTSIVASSTTSRTVTVG